MDMMVLILCNSKDCHTRTGTLRLLSVNKGNPNLYGHSLSKALKTVEACYVKALN